jgi:hypothetical protein
MGNGADSKIPNIFFKLLDEGDEICHLVPWGRVINLIQIPGVLPLPREFPFTG